VRILDPAGKAILKLRIARAKARVPEPQDFDESVVEVWRENHDGAVFAWAQSGDGERWMHLPGVASYRVRPGRSEVTAIPDPSAERQSVVSAYERTVLPMAVQLGGREVLHASAVLAPEGIVAFCAVSETGKSTIAQEFSQLGYGIWADDAVAFESTDGSVAAIPLPFQVPLRPRPGLDRDHVTAAAPDIPTPQAAPGLLGAVCVLERAEPSATNAVQIRQLSPAEAFPAVLAHAYCYSLDDVGRNRRMIDHYLELTSRVPIFSVIFRAGLEHIPALLGEIEQAVGMAPNEDQ